MQIQCKTSCANYKHMEATFKIILDKRYQKKNLTYPLRMRIFQDRKYKTHSLNIDLRETDWDEQLQQVNNSNPNQRLYNVKIATLKAKVQKSIFINEDEETLLTPEQIINEVSRKKHNSLIQEKPDLLEYGRKHIAKLETAGQIGNSIVYDCAINKLKSYAKTDKLTFEKVNYSFIEQFNLSLLAEGMKVNSISNYLRTIRALFNKAIKEKVIDTNLYPFSSFKIKTEFTINRTLSIDEIKNIVSLDLPVGSSIWHHKNLFLLSYCLIGINFSDLLTLKKENFVDGRIIFRRRKTHKVYSIYLHPKAKEIFRYYFQPDIDNDGYVLPFVIDKKNLIALKRDVLQVIKNTNDNLGKMAKLCKIDKPITTYYARYSWANIARILGYSKDLIAEALGHEYGNKVTGIYLDHYDNDTLDNMNAKVIEAVFGKS